MRNYDNFLEDSLRTFNSFFGKENNENQIVPVGNILTRGFMKTDILDKGDNFLLNLEVPSFEKKDINISLKNGYLTISAQKEVETKDEGLLYSERFNGTIERQFYVGNNIKKEDISAKMENGLLEVKILKPKKTKDKSDLITIS